MKIAGVGAIIVRVGSPNVILHNSQYTVSLEAIVDDVTSSASAWAQGHPCITKISSIEIEVPEDDQGFPEVLGFSAGAVLTLLLKRGTFPWYDRAEQTVVRSYRVVTEPNRVRRVTLTCEYGVYTYMAAPVI